MAKTAQLIGHAAFAALFSPVFPVIKAFHQTVFRQIIRRAKSRCFTQDKSPARQKRAATSVRADFPPGKNESFTQNKSPARQKAGLLIRIAPTQAETCRVFTKTKMRSISAKGKLSFLLLLKRNPLDYFIFIIH